MKVKKIILIMILLSPAGFSQVDFSAGGFAGGGSFSGNSFSVGAFTSGIFAEAGITLFEEVHPRIGFIFLKDFNAVLPDTRKAYYPFLMGASIKGVTYQYFENKIFLEEGVGLLTLRDRTFPDTDVWDYGVVLSFSAGYDFRDFNLKGIRAGIGGEYGITFFNTLPRYFSMHIFLNFTI